MSSKMNTPLAMASTVHGTQDQEIRLSPLAASIRRALAAGLSLSMTNAVAGELPIPKAALVTMGRADQIVNGNKMTINQYSDRAVLNWEKFNIGKDSSVQFKQPSAASIALNRIYQADPSQIMGNLSANGQVYLLNPNGFLFGKNSSVNVNTLVASSLDITDETFDRGISKVINQDGRAALTGNGQVYRTDASGNFVLDSKGQKIKIGIEFEKGAKVVTDKAGRIIAAAPSVVNKGELVAPDGQILMVAATDKVYLQETSGDPSLRGLVVEVATGGEVTNVGKIVSDRGNVTLMGFAVNQQGIVSAKTAVQANGSIRLLAREGGVTRREGDKWLLQSGSTQRKSELDDRLGKQGKVTLAKGSLTEATPNLKDKTTALDGQIQEASLIEVMGKEIHVENDAVIRSRSGKVSLTATENPTNPASPNVKNDSKVIIGSGAKIDVSGIKNVGLAMERNVVEVELRSNELRDAPLQKDGPLYAQKVNVDIRKGTPLADISGALDRIARTVAERSTSGGSVSVVSEGSAVLSQGSKVDISGGSVKYRSGYVNTSLLIGPDGRSVTDIGYADPNVKYIGVVESIVRKFKGSTLTTTNDLVGPPVNGTAKFEAGYVEGKSAGSIDIEAAALALEGEMNAIAINGPRQKAPELQAVGGKLAIDLARTPLDSQAVRFGQPKNDQTPGSEGTVPTNPNNPNQPLELTLDGTRLRKTGLQSVSIHTNANIDVDQGHTIAMVDGGSLELDGGEVNVAGNIQALAGAVHLNTHIVGGGGASGLVTLEDGSQIDVRGRWNNDRPAVSTAVDKYDGSPLRINGGTVAIKAEGDVKLSSGSLIDVSGGAHRQLNREIKAGDAGHISLEAAGINGSDLSVDGTLLGYAVTGGRGGSLSLTSDQVVLGGTESKTESGNFNSPLWLGNTFFTQGGFAQYTVASNKSGVLVDKDAALQVSVLNRVLKPSAINKKTGSDLRDFSDIMLLSEEKRPAGDLSLVLSQKVGFGGKDAAIRVAEGASIRTDARGKLSLTSDGNIEINGALTAKGGEIAMKITPPASTDPGFLPNQGIWLGAGTHLDVSGTSLTYQDGQRRLAGEILNGGTISLHADRGFIVADQWSDLDVSGTTGYLDLPSQTVNRSNVTERQQIASKAGKIDLQAAEGMQLFGSMKANGGDEYAEGGTLHLELNPFTRNEPDQVGTGLPFPKAASVISLSQSIGDTRAPAQGSNISSAEYGKAVVSSDQLDAARFSNINLRTPGRIELNGDVNLSVQRSLSLDAPVLAFNEQSGAEGGLGFFSAAHVALGSTQTRPGSLEPTTGKGNLLVAAGLLDLTGTTVLQGFGSAQLNSSGDLRMIGVRTSQQQRDFKGEMLSAGDLILTANQIYPSTLTDFRVAIQGNPNGTITVARNGIYNSTPLSAGGKLTLEAANIRQGGNIKAPLGEIALKATNTLELADGSTTSNSAENTVIPFGKGQGGLEWIFPLGEQNLILSAPPEKKLVLEGAVVNVAKGAAIDTSGGGDLSAYEHVPGPGGSYDLLDPSSRGYQGSYAILPNYKTSAAPVDPLELPGSNLKVGDSIYLSNGSGLPAGNYILLPAHYALLPGAYLVTPKAGTQDLLPGMKQKDSYGASVVAGYRTVAGTTIRDPRWNGFAVEKGDAILKRAEYTKYSANEFYARKAKENGTIAPYLPEDAGSMVISAGSGLKLDGTINALPTVLGKGGRLDIAADSISVVSQYLAGQNTSGGVELIAEQLNALKVSSIALGAIRNFGPDGVDIKVIAEDVRLGDNAKLEGQEYILAAKKEITLAQGSSIKTEENKDKAQGEKTIYRVDGDAAFARVSSGPQVDLQRSGTVGRIGSINMAAGATLSTTGSMMLDATAENQLLGTLTTNGGSVALGAQRISLGEVDSTATGLVLDQGRLNSLDAGELILRSSSDISLYGAADVSAKHLTLRSGGVLGFNNDGAVAKLRADTIRLDNPGGVLSPRTASGQGNLQLSAGTITLGEGAYTVAGFNNLNLTATNTLLGEKTGNLVALANVDMRAPVLTGAKGSNTTIDATGHSVNIDREGGDTSPNTADLGGRLAITADSIRHASSIVLPSGGVRLNALKGDLVLTEGSVIDVAGRTLEFGKTLVQTAGGNIDLAAQNGNIALQSGATLNLAGSQGGRLSISVPKGSLSLGATLNAQGRVAGGRFDIDVGNAASVGDLGALGLNLKTSGFSGELALRARSGDWRLNEGTSLEARMVSLAADQGGIQLDGAIMANGPSARVNVTAADHLRLGSAARVEAKGTADQNGRVKLTSLDSDGDGKAGISIASGAQIDVNGNDGQANGEVALRAGRTGDDVDVDGNLKDSIKGSAETTVEAVRTYQKTGVITAGDIAAWKTETDAYMVNGEAIENRLGIPGGLLAGLEIKSTGDLTLDSTGWDLVSWRYGGRAGVLSLNAANNLFIQGNLSDGFRDEPQGIDLSATLGAGRTVPVKDMLQPGKSWGYQLTAGNSVNVGSNVFVRTGTGNIEIEAGQDMVLTDAGSAIYTAGRPVETSRYGSFKDSFVAYSFFGEYPVEGGDISIKAGRDVVGAVTGQFFDSWFARTGNWTQNQDHTGETPTAWSIAIGGPVGTGRAPSSFNQNVGALGGGDVVVTAGRDVNNLSVVIPTTGKQVGEPSNPSNPSDSNFKTNVVDVQGGGNLKVTAGNDVAGGTYYTGRGHAEITAAGSIKGSAENKNLGSVIALGDSTFSLKAGNSIELGAAINPTVINDARSKNFFFTYGADSGINLEALSGNVTLQTDVSGMIDHVNSLRPANNQIKFPGVSQEALSVYPAALNVAALQGDIVFGQSFITYPSAKADFSLLAGGDITTGKLGNNVNITQSDTDPTLLPSVVNPSSSWEDASQRLQPFGNSNLIHAKTPVHRGDANPAQIHAKGSILSNDPLLFSLPKAAEIRAGKDLMDVSFQIQHADYGISSISAGRDIQFTTPRNAQGNLLNLTREIRVAGPGQLWVTSGRTIDLGASEGIYTIGNTNNSALAEQGASVSIMAGLGEAAQFGAFAKKYDPLSDKYSKELTIYMQKRTGDVGLDKSGAVAAYQALPEEQQREFLLAVMFREIRDASSAAAKSGKVADYEPGYAAIEAMFPGAGSKDSKYSGDLKLFFSKVHTVDGGDINLMVPGGLVNAGLAVAFAGSKPASELGIVAQREGAVNGLVNGDFLVNQSRVFAMDGGDITLWSSNGNIDAGRGAKAAIAAPPPNITFDEQGNLKVEFPPVVSGSGIRTAASTVSKPGDVYLAAPKGVIDAGEAGIGGSNITIAATAVIGAGNIDVGGSSTGVPSANVSVPVAPAGAAAAASAAANTATDTAESAVNNDVNQANEKNELAERLASDNSPRLNPLQIDILGFGECGVADIKEGKPGCV